MANTTDLIELHLKNGGNKLFWDINHIAVGEFIKAKELNPLAQLQVRSALTQVKLEKELISKPYLKNGGIKAPHLHYNGEIFMVDREQWQGFSQNVIKGFQEKLSHAKSVSYDQLMELSDAMESIV